MAAVHTHVKQHGVKWRRHGLALSGKEEQYIHCYHVLACTTHPAPGVD